MKKVLWTFMGVVAGGFFGVQEMVIGGLIGFFVARFAAGEGQREAQASTATGEGNCDPGGGRVGHTVTDVNPATGLPMMGGIDVAGNPFGTDSNDGFCSHSDDLIGASFDQGVSPSGFNNDW
ncbi:hypothetical protein [Marinobacter sp. X15-166B]|uniref:hypothetical protein n=1 Tax=Marinobacter sp. X15-166B TaxID=1897620 RepID=UPI00085C5406|nr:hypothetical protein [Marinobacter sp. X15-166B]OEY65970.1 hypothetical protein BG841_05535 [Marinobacter sp. X15-166B]